MNGRRAILVAATLAIATLALALRPSAQDGGLTGAALVARTYDAIMDARSGPGARALNSAWRSSSITPANPRRRFRTCGQ
jgi:hypothetical protein